MPPFDPARPYNDLPPLPPTADIETKAILKQCIPARVALAELKEVGSLIPNQGMLINSIPFREAQGSSEIENIFTTTARLFTYAATEAPDADPGTKEAFRYQTALQDGFNSLRSRLLTASTAVRICRTIKAVDLGIRAVPGTTLKNDITGEIIYTPPLGQDLLRGMLANWESFLHDDTLEIDPLVRMAVLHYQFEAIHPFTDGNGRTGRILNILYLVSQGLLDIPVLYLSRYIIENKDDYYRLLQGVTKNGDWQPWILYMLAAVENTAQWTTAKIRAIHRLMRHTDEFVATEAPGIYRRELVDLIFNDVVCQITDVTDAGIAARATASKYLNRLCEIGVLNQIRLGRRKFFQQTKFTKLLIDEDNRFEPYG